MGIITYITAIIVFILDQISKFIAVTSLSINNPITIISNFFCFNIAYNKGAAFSILNNNTELLIIISLTIMIILYIFKKDYKKNELNDISFGLIYGGLLGNLLDRIIKGYVIDFIDIYIFNYDFPIFNIADIAIVSGVTLLLIESFRKDNNNENRSNVIKRKTR